MFKQDIIKLLEEPTSLKQEEILNLIETPPNSEMGDYAFPCFVLSKKKKKAPNQIAEDLTKKLSKNLSKNIEKVIAVGPYLNFFINKKELTKKIIKINSNFGKVNLGKKKKILIDFSGPNIGKPMHIGHIRSTIIGDSLMRIYDYLGYNPIGVNYLGDVGLHIGKLIVAYEMWLDKDALKKGPVAELLRLYVKFCGKEKTEIKEGMEEEMQDNEWTNKAKEKLKLLELEDKKTKKIWDDIHKYSGKGFDKVYDMLNIDFTETAGQSQFGDRGKDILTNALEKGVVKREDDGALYIEIEMGGKMQKKYVLRSNQTASYITYDIGAAVERFEKYKFNKMIYVTDFRQHDHFISLFMALKLIGYDFADNLHHLGFGTIKFGKEIMATRKGKVILLDDVLKKTIQKAEQGIKKRKTKGDAKKVGVGAIKYIVLKNEPQRDVSFTWENALSFEGNTAPYLQYSYARASSILKKAGNFNKGNVKVGKLEKHEIELIKTISKFPEIVEKAGENQNPSLIANYSYDLAKQFSEFYHNCKVLGDENEALRLRLIDSFRTTLHNALHLLGIETMPEM
ncbi:arginine--tRNA ligase [archaeon]|jgi:arginyl-tRNA synthetase|nr:arginine--tRNA ligase [archaeon]MBT4241646.1 arginine--tRNA ligase [archaeon]MBT4418041.1 arginine--tRNA ligase [archaeon]